jgi:hypothetical protein
MSGNLSMELPVPDAVLVTPDGRATRILRTYLQILSARTGGSAGTPPLTVGEVNLLIAAGLSPETAARISGDSTNATAAAAAQTTASAALPKLGTTTNDNAAAGNIGEYISSTVLAGAAVALTSTVTADITSISLTAGDWDVEAVLAFAPAATTTVTVIEGAISQTSATLPTIPASGGYARLALAFTAGATQVIATSRARMSLAGATTIYLPARATFAVSTMGAYGFIGARRPR